MPAPCGPERVLHLLKWRPQDPEFRRRQGKTGQHPGSCPNPHGVRIVGTMGSGLGSAKEERTRIPAQPLANQVGRAVPGSRERKDEVLSGPGVPRQMVQILGQELGLRRWGPGLECARGPLLQAGPGRCTTLRRCLGEEVSHCALEC